MGNMCDKSGNPKPESQRSSLHLGNIKAETKKPLNVSVPNKSNY